VKPAEYIAKLIELGIDKTPFDTERTYYKKGLRGQLHGSLSCWKAPSKYSATEQKIKPSKLGKNICKECIDDALGQDKLTYQIGKKYLDFHKKIKSLKDEISENQNPTLAMAQLNELERIQINLTKLDSKSNSYHENLALNIRKDLVEFKEKLGNLGQGANEEILRATTYDLIAKKELFLNQEVEQLGTVKEIPLAKLLLKTWRKTWVKTNSFAKAKEETLQELNNYKTLSSVTQLKDIPLTPILEGEELEKYTKRNWTEYLESNTPKIIDRWEQLATEVLQDQTPILVVVKRIQQETVTGIFAAILSSYTLSTNATRTEYALVAPKPVANWLQQRVGSYEYTDSVGGFSAKIEYLHTDIPTKTELETALSLWDTNISGPHSTFENALATARRI
jgi:hypothetical protein